MKKFVFSSSLVLFLLTAAAIDSITLQLNGNFAISIDRNVWEAEKYHEWVEQDGGYESEMQLIEDPAYIVSIFMADIHEYNKRMETVEEESHKPPPRPDAFISWIERTAKKKGKKFVFSDPIEKYGFIYIRGTEESEDGSVKFAIHLGMQATEHGVIFIFHMFDKSRSNDNVPYSDELFNTQYEEILETFEIRHETPEETENTSGQDDEIDLPKDGAKTDDNKLYVFDFPDSFILTINKEKWELIANNIKKESLKVKRRYNLKQDTGYKLEMMVSATTERDRQELSDPEIFFNALTDGLEEHGIPPVFSKIKHKNGMYYIQGIVRDESEVLLAFHMAYYLNDKHFVFLSHSYEIEHSTGDVAFNPEIFTAQFEEIVDSFHPYPAVESNNENGPEIEEENTTETDLQNEQE
ncbi:MAG: hypothetical protein ABUK01_01960 [Leptospirales bacterium]